MPYFTKQLNVFILLIGLVFLLVFQNSLLAARTGKIAGQVVDAGNLLAVANHADV